MADIVDKETRSRMMSGIRSKHTAPELALRRALHSRGLRYRLHLKELPGKPDMTFPRHHAVVLVHGCFWHGHDCRYFRWPETRPDFWRQKIEGNRANDQKTRRSLLASGWRICIVWECALRGRSETALNLLADRISVWLRDGDEFMEEAG